jgi:hypothetical protein
MKQLIILLCLLATTYQTGFACLESGIRNATKVPGRIVIETLDNGIIFDSGEYVDKESGMTVKVRGNTSARYNPKKPYKIKLQKKGDMLCSGNSLLKDKNWLLQRTDNMNTVIGLKANELLKEDDKMNKV